MEESYNFVNEELPDFVGENPMEWILTAEKQSAMGIHENGRCSYVVVSLMVYGEPRC
jgi:hypothetical protein